MDEIGVGLKPLKEIHSKEQITFNYDWSYESSEIPENTSHYCYCGSKSCKIFIENDLKITENYIITFALEGKVLI